MASVISDIECPQCSRVAMEDYYYKIGDKYIHCGHCGYNYTRIYKDNSSGESQFEVKEYTGFGIFVLTKKKDIGKKYLLNSKPTEEQIQKYRDEFEQEDVVQEQSYLVTYNNGMFTCLFGTLPQDFLLSYDEYREKYGNDDDFVFDYEEELI